MMATPPAPARSRDPIGRSRHRSTAATAAAAHTASWPRRHAACCSHGSHAAARQHPWPPAQHAPPRATALVAFARPVRRDQQQQLQQLPLATALCEAERWWDLLSLAEQRGQELTVSQWLHLLFRVFDQLHESDVPSAEYPALNAELTSALAAAADALAGLVQQPRAPRQCVSPPGTPDAAAAEAAARLSSQLADMLYAIALYATSAGEVGQRRQYGPAADWCCCSASSALLDAVAAAGSSWHMPSVARKDAVSLLWAFGKLEQLQPPRRDASHSSSSRQALLSSLCRHIADLIQLSNNTADAGSSPAAAAAASMPPSATRMLSEPCHPDDLADAVVGLAAAQHKDAAAAALLDAVAHETYRQVSNRHSSSPAAVFSVDGVLTLLHAYRDLDYRDGSALRMFDAAAGWVVKRVRSRHMQAPSSPQQLAALAEAFADLEHRSVVVPELLQALDRQACKAAGNAMELHADHPGVNFSANGCLACHCWWSLQQQASFLRAHLRLGYALPQQLLVAMMPALQLELAQQQMHRCDVPLDAEEQAAAVDLLAVLTDAQHNPGQAVLSALGAAAWGGDAAGQLDAGQLASLLFSSAQMGVRPPDEQLAAAAEAAVLAASDGQLGMDALVRVLWALAGPLGCLDIAGFGWLLVALAATPTWQRLSDAQVAAVAEAAQRLGQDGADMVTEVLPAALARRVAAAGRQA